MPHSFQRIYRIRRYKPAQAQNISRPQVVRRSIDRAAPIGRLGDLLRVHFIVNGIDNRLEIQLRLQIAARRITQEKQLVAATGQIGVERVHRPGSRRLGWSASKKK